MANCKINDKNECTADGLKINTYRSDRVQKIKRLKIFKEGNADKWVDYAENIGLCENFTVNKTDNKACSKQQ